MQAVVTAIGAYNGVPAFEYEIRDGVNVLAQDYVIVHPKAGETWDDMVALVRDSYLRIRLAKWETTPVQDRSNLSEAKVGGKRLKAERKGSLASPEIAGQKATPTHLLNVNLPPTARPPKDVSDN